MAGRDRIFHLLRQLERAACRCPAHSHTFHQAAGDRKTDYAFEMASSNIRYGAGVSAEVGMDLQNLGAQNVCLMTDRTLTRLPPVQAVLESLVRNRVHFQVFDDVRVEPSDSR
uniref:Hydroxyacid-oxoacid transhydrogenase, mitochondrial n=1 Tax=Xiphophorus couchianus TaxID=32473 RepID=A0A3B5MEM8_9TELE